MILILKRLQVFPVLLYLLLHLGNQVFPMEKERKTSDSELQVYVLGKNKIPEVQSTLEIQ